MTFSTSDLQLASALLADGEKIIKLDNSNPSRISVVFEWSDTLDDRVASFDEYTLMGNVHGVLDAHKKLKKKIIAVKDLEQFS